MKPPRSIVEGFFLELFAYFICGHASSIASVDERGVWISDKMFIWVVNHQIVR